MTSLRRSMYLAFGGGVLVPILETIRRCDQLTDPSYFINWFDDYVMGAFLVIAAWQVYKSPLNGRPYLCAAWGMATGMMVLSFFGQLQNLDQDDPAPVSSMTVAIIKAALLLSCVLGLVLALKMGKDQREG